MRLAKYFFVVYLVLLLVSCGTTRQGVQKHQERDLLSRSSPESSSKRMSVVEQAQDFIGTAYKYGGSTKNGMDCSGLVYTSFQRENLQMPRTSRAMALEGERITLASAQTGDLLFFGTSKNRNVINHVGLVVQHNPEELLFIHSTTSRGVIISSLKETYWREHFVMARSLF